MVKVIHSQFSKISKQTAALVDLRPQIRDLYFAYIDATDRVTLDKTKEIKDSDVFEFQDKSADESLDDFINRVGESIPALLKLWLNDNKIIELTNTEIYIDDSGKNYFPYAVSSKKYIHIDQINDKSEAELKGNLEELIKNKTKEFGDKSIQEKQDKVNERTAAMKALIETEKATNALIEAANMAGSLIPKGKDPTKALIATLKRNKEAQKALKPKLDDAINKKKEAMMKVLDRHKSFREKTSKYEDKTRHAIRVIKTDAFQDLRKVDRFYSLSQRKRVTLGGWIYLVAETCDLVGAEVVVKVKQGVGDGIFSIDESYPLLTSTGGLEMQELKEFRIKVEKEPYKTEKQDETTTEIYSLGLNWNKWKGVEITVESIVTHKNKIGETASTKKSLLQLSMRPSSDEVLYDWRKYLDENKETYLVLQAEVEPKDKDMVWKGKYNNENDLYKNAWPKDENEWISFSNYRPIKEAVTVMYKLNNETHGKCAHGTYNHAYNFVQLLKGNEDKLAWKALGAGGDANQPGYHNNLVSLGYSLEDKGEISRQQLIEGIEKGSYKTGDVIAYWTVDPDIDENAKNADGSFVNSHKRYGHTQIFTDGLQEGANGNKWATDDKDNFGAQFVYGKRTGSKWHFKIFRAP